MDHSDCLELLKKGFERYSPLTPDTWSRIASVAHLEQVKKGTQLLRLGQVAKQLHFVCKGALRSFYTDENGDVYNKNLFLEGDFAGSKVSLLQQTPSYFGIEALEDTTVMNINFSMYKQLISEHDDLKDFYIAYIEKNWIMEKEKREIALVMESATERYQRLLEKHPDVDQRIPQLHIAAHLGVTPTQLSRIRKAMKKN
jgi:CRP-like cAMP-binding protein